MFEQHELRKLEALVQESLRLQAETVTIQMEILRRLPSAPPSPLPPHARFRTVSIAVQFSSLTLPTSPTIPLAKDTTLMNTLALLIGQSSIGTVTPLEADGLTVTPGAVVSNQSWSISDPSLTLTPNSDGTATILGVSDSAAPVFGTVSATVTDADGTVSNLSATFTVTVTGTAPPPVARTVSIGVSFSTPVAA